MRELLNNLYRECSVAPSPSPEQSMALAIAAAALGAVGVPAAQLREASFALRAAFEK